MGTEKERSPIQGRLGSVSLNDLIQLLAMTRRTATLALKQGRTRGYVFFRDGQIVHAEAGRVEGEDALLRLLEWSEAEFAVEDGVKSLPRVSIDISTEALLLDTLRRLDEQRSAGRSPESRSASSATETTPQTRGTPRRYPRPPRRRRSARAPWAGAAVGLLATVTLSFLAAANLLFGAPWEQLPDRQAPSPPPSYLRPRLDLALQPPSQGAVAAEPTFESHTAPPDTSAGPAPVPTPPSTDGTPLAREGHLTVVAEPWAFVSVDGTLVGETPLQEITLQAGDHQLTLTNPNVVGTIRAVVSIRPGDEMVRRFSFLDVGSLLVLAEAWADVEVDGRAVGQTPLPRLAVPSGPHVIRFHHPELGVRERTALVRSGETTRVHVDWRTP